MLPTFFFSNINELINLWIFFYSTSRWGAVVHQSITLPKKETKLHTHIYTYGQLGPYLI